MERRTYTIPTDANYLLFIKTNMKSRYPNWLSNYQVPHYETAANYYPTEGLPQGGFALALCLMKDGKDRVVL